ncbi:MAG: GxxExxY protein [Calditrichaeota bacterium]|nr:GxxExxY protein [Calditrichota bacterium]
MQEATFLERELSESVLGCAFRVYNALGNGFLEKVYENALVHELRKVGLTAEQQKRIDVRYDGVVVGDYYADIVVEGRIIVEIKACESLSPAHEAQLLHYLKATGCHVGYLLNFGSPGRLQFKRMVF